MKKILALTLIASLGGCAQVTQFEDFITSPKTQATVATLEKTAVVFICNVSAISNIAGQIEVASGAGKSTIGTNGKVYAASTTACTGIGGLVAGSTAVPVGTTVIQ